MGLRAIMNYLASMKQHSRTARYQLRQIRHFLPYYILTDWQMPCIE